MSLLGHRMTVASEVYAVQRLAEIVLLDLYLEAVEQGELLSILFGL